MKFIRRKKVKYNYYYYKLINKINFNKKTKKAL